MSNRNGVLSGATLLGVGNVTKILIQVVSVPVLARILGPDVYGLIAFSTALVMFCGLLSETGISGAIGRGFATSIESESTVFWLSLASGVAVSALLDILSWAFLPKADAGRILPIILALNPVVLFSAITSLPNGLALREQKFWAFAVAEIMSVIAGAVVAWTLALNGFGVWSLVAQINLIFALKFIVVSTVTTPKVYFYFDLKSIRGVVTYGVNAVLSNLATFIGRSVDNVIVAGALGARSLGYYAMGFQLVTMPSGVLTSPINGALFPLIGRNSGRPEHVSSLFLASLSFVYLVVFPIFMGLALVSDLIVGVFFGSKWTPSIPVIRYLCAYACIDAINGTVSTALLAVGLSRQQLVLSACTAVATLIGVLIGVQFGAVGVSIAMGAAVLSIWPFYIFAARRGLSTRMVDALSRMAAPMLCTAAMVVAVYTVRFSGYFNAQLPELIASVLMGGAFYASLAVILCGKQIRDVIHLLRQK
jgi:O-antigen/teichoic acid export membrane protein